MVESIIKVGVDVLFRSCGFVVICCLLLLQGCNTSDKKTAGTTVDTQAKGGSTEAFVVSGRVNSGSLLGSDLPFVVTLHPVVKGRVFLDISVAQTQSNSQGFYSLSVAAKYQGQPAVIRSYMADTKVELLLAVPSLSASAVNSISLLTHIAATEFLAPSDLGSLTEAAVAIFDANTMISSRFGVIGDITSLELVNVNNQSEREGGSGFSIRYSALGAAILTAVEVNEPSLTKSKVIETFTSDYINNGLLGNTSYEGVTSYADILLALYSLVGEMKLEATNNTVLERLHIELATELGLAQVEDEGIYSHGFSTNSSGLNYVDKAKALVQNIRQIVASIDVQSIIGLSNISSLLAGDDPLTKQLEGFGVQVDISDLVSGGELTHIQAALKVVAFSVLDSLSCHYQEETCEQVGTRGVIVMHDAQEPGTTHLHEFVIRQQLDVCEREAVPCLVNIDLTLQLVLDNPGFGFNFNDLPSLILNGASMTFSGQLSQDGLILGVQPNKVQDIRLGASGIGLTESVDGNTLHETISFETEEATLLLPIFLSKGSEQNTLATVNLSVGPMGVDFVDDITKEFYSSGSVAKTVSTIVVSQLVDFALNMTGVVNNLGDEDFLVSLNMAQPGFGFRGGASYQTTSYRDCDIDGDGTGCTEAEMKGQFEGESELVYEDGMLNFIKLDASVGYKAILKGVAEPVIVQLSGSRESPDLNTINGLKVIYPGSSLYLTGQFEGGKVISMGATNLDGITMDVYSKGSVNGKKRRYGTIVGPDGSLLGTITPTTDLVHIQFEDGYFASLLL